MTIYKHRFPSVQAANAFVCGVNWVNNMTASDVMGPALEVQDILVGELFGELVATVVVIEDDGSDEVDEDVDQDHTEHV